MDAFSTGDIEPVIVDNGPPRGLVDHHRVAVLGERDIAMGNGLPRGEGQGGRHLEQQDKIGRGPNQRPTKKRFLEHAIFFHNVPTFLRTAPVRSGDNARLT